MSSHINIFINYIINFVAKFYLYTYNILSKIGGD